MLAASIVLNAESSVASGYDTGICNAVTLIGPVAEGSVMTSILPTAPAMANESLTAIFGTGATTTGIVVIHAAGDDLDFTCDETLRLGRVALASLENGDEVCVLLDSILVLVDGDMDAVAGELGNRQGWTVINRISLVPILVAEYSPDQLTLDELNSEMNAIRAISGVSAVEYNALASGASGSGGGDTVTASEDNELPTQIVLGQNYPNPFNPVTSIAYDLDRTMHVTLKVYDAFGREVATLADGVRNAGNHRVRFDGSGLASGMYLYRLETPDRLLAKRMILLK